MASYPVFLLVLFLYIGSLVAIGLYCSRGRRSLADFWLAGRGVGGWALGFSAAASWLTAGALLAVIGFFLLQGMGSIWGFVAPNILALLGIALLVGRIKRLPAITQPELLEMRYGGWIRLPVALIITVVMILFAVADIKGFALVLQVFYGVSPAHAALIVGLAVALYVSLGGLSAVIITDIFQFLCLAGFVIVMAALVLGAAASGTAVPATELLTTMPAQWWNPMSIGLPLVLVFVLAIVPGWITEQDPWQRVWAAKNERSARRGMVFGAILVSLVFAGCAIIAIGLDRLYPEIAAMGFPMGMAKAEPALLAFIMDSGPSDLVLACCAVALATAAMSCADTFAASGGSCLARDVYQRCFRPGATMREMRLVNRLAVLFIIASATAASFLIANIIDAIHIATFIASASYFFVLMGGLYWKRANSAGAAASLVAGFAVQVGLVLVDLTRTAPMAPPYLESVHPFLLGHGVLVAMAVSGTVFVVVSLATRPVAQRRLVPFFEDEALAFAASIGDGLILPGEAHQADVAGVSVRHQGGRVQLHLSANLLEGMDWLELVRLLCASGQGWFQEGGEDSVCRYGGGAALTRVSLTRGEDRNTLWYAAEGPECRQEMLARGILAAKAETALLLGLGGRQAAPAVHAEEEVTGLVCPQG